MVDNGMRPPGRVTLADVAARAGVSRGAVSFVLNGRTDQRISAATSERVLAAARELGYRPNLTARVLRTGTSGTVALISDFISSTSTANAMIRGALQELRGQGRTLFTVDTLGEPDIEERLVHNLLDRQVDGVLYAAMFTRVVTVPDALRGAPVALLNCRSGDDFAAPTVLPDERGAGAAAAAALLEAGHRDGIYFVGDLPPGMTGGAQWHSWAPLALPERLAGLRGELARASVELAGTVPIDTDWEPSHAYDAVHGLLANRVRPRALVCINDAAAFGAYQALADAGLRIPEDVSVVAFDDSDLARWLRPGLSSVALPHEELGREAARMLAAGTRQTRRIPMPLHRRASIGPPRPGGLPSES